MSRPRLFIVIGSASTRSSNQQLMEWLAPRLQDDFEVQLFTDLKTLPPFDPEQSVHRPPATIQAFRNCIDAASAVILCTPEYVFSLPSGLKNALEWCVATTVFTNKPLGLITASADGRKGHEELQRIMHTLMARFTAATTLLIPGIRSKMKEDGSLADPNTQEALMHFASSMKQLIHREEDAG
jgi:NAD(P)H-dependent FMN reductase